jgi:hypothetical protein
MKHLLSVGEASANIGPESYLDTGPPAAKTTGWDAITEDNVPTRLITLAGCAACARPESMELAIDLDMLGWRDTSSLHSIDKLDFYWFSFNLRWGRPRPA